MANRTTCLSKLLEQLDEKKILGLPNWTQPMALSNLEVLRIFLINYFQLRLNLALYFVY